jgi:hypothetical protein
MHGMWVFVHRGGTRFWSDMKARSPIAIHHNRVVGFNVSLVSLKMGDRVGHATNEAKSSHPVWV